MHRRKRLVAFTVGHPEGVAMDDFAGVTTANESAATSYFSMKARATCAIAARSDTDGAATPAGLGSGCASARRSDKAGEIAALAASLMNCRRSSFMDRHPGKQASG
jgi:hypothetical protein